jgi:hypothetical protein
MKNEQFKDDLRAKLALDDETIKGDISNFKKVVKFVVFGGGFFLAGGLTCLFNFLNISDITDLGDPLYFTKSLCETEQKTCHKTPVFMWIKKEDK